MLQRRVRIYTRSGARVGLWGTTLRITFFVGSVVGHIDNPPAIYTRGLAHGLALRGNDVRIVEERQNDAFARTLRVVGSGAARHFYERFTMFQYATYEPRSGARLLEWVTREIALIDVAVAVSGLEQELCRWLANVSHAGITRAYLAWQPEQLSEQIADLLELDKFDLILAPDPLPVALRWHSVERVVAAADVEATLVPAGPVANHDPIAAALMFERAVSQVG